MKKRILWLLGLFLLVYLLPLGIRPIFVSDETRYAEIPREMRATGDWVVPRFNGWDYFEKPVLGYWLNAVSQELIGESAFAVRLPSALAAGISALSVLLLLGRRRKEDSGLSALAVAFFLILPLVYACGTYAVLDGPFAAFFTLAMALFFRGEEAESPVRKRWYYAGFGAASGLAFLTKGLLGFALPVLVIVPYMLWRRKFKELLRFPWVPLLLAGMVILPWAVAVQHRAPDYWRFFLWHEHFQRFFEPAAGSQHPEPFWFFVPVLLGGAFPLMVLAPAAVIGLRKAWKDPLVVFSLLWSGLLFAFFSASGGKLGTYILPCLPPLAVLTVLGTGRYLQGGGTRLFDAPAKGLGILLLVALWGFAALHILPFPRNWKLYTPHEIEPLLLGAVAVVAWAGLLFWSTFPARAVRKLARYAAGPVMVMACMPLVIPAMANYRNAPLDLLERNAARVKAESLILTTPHYVGAVDWCYQRTDAWLVHGAGELEYGLDQAPADQKRFVPLEDLPEFAASHAGEGRLILFVSEPAYGRFEADLPDPLRVDRDQGFVWAQY